MFNQETKWEHKKGYRPNSAATNRNYFGTKIRLPVSIHRNRDMTIISLPQGLKSIYFHYSLSQSLLIVQPKKGGPYVHCQTLWAKKLLSRGKIDVHLHWWLGVIRAFEQIQPWSPMIRTMIRSSPDAQMIIKNAHIDQNFRLHVMMRLEYDRSLREMNRCLPISSCRCIVSIRTIWSTKNHPPYRIQ